MNTTITHPKGLIRQRQPVPESQADQELVRLKARCAEILSSREKSLAFLQRVGIIDEHGRLTEPYRSE